LQITLSKKKFRLILGKGRGLKDLDACIFLWRLRMISLQSFNYVELIHIECQKFRVIVHLVICINKYPLGIELRWNQIKSSFKFFEIAVITDVGRLWFYFGCSKMISS
jgi:hypothetical protein